MEKWVQDHLAELLAFIAVVPLFGALAKHVVRTLVRMGTASGWGRRRYRRWFLGQHRTVKNIYLDREETLDLATTFVPLAVSGGGLDQRTSAGVVLADPARRRVIIVGEPGSGKSTLLKAFGTALLPSNLWAGARFPTQRTKRIGRRREVPILVELRRFGLALQAEPGLTLGGYIIDTLLGKGAGLPQGSAFLDRLIARRRCLLLLDGLDEVADDLYPTVRGRVLAFVDEARRLDEAGLRVVVTCRSQNFVALGDDWIPSFAAAAFTLAPLRDVEVLEFLARRRSDYGGDRSPEAFYAAIEGSGMMDLHRVPLILTISLGMYLTLAGYEIPRKLAAFYDEMIRELLRRHDFRTDALGGKVNRYNADDKHRFLRQFALDTAQREGQFDEFTYADLLVGARRLVGTVPKLDEADVPAFVTEIIDHSGLLSRVVGEDLYIFAHRSVHEYLAAVQLARTPSSAAETLLAHSDDHQWRQIAIFYAALEPEDLAGFVRQLADRNLGLAGHCVARAVALPTTTVDDVIVRLERAAAASNDRACLSAVIAIARSGMPAAQSTALFALARLLYSTETGPVDRIDQFAAMDDASLLELIDELSQVESPMTVTSVIRLARFLPDSVELVRPLWRCLAPRSARSVDAVATDLVGRLLLIVTDPAARRELEEQPAFVPAFATDAARRDAYPFVMGHDRQSNLVTLLTWEHRLGKELLASGYTTPYTEARLADEQAWRRLEADHERRLTSIRPYWIGATLFTTGVIGSIAVIASMARREGASGLLVEGWGWHLGLMVAVALAAFLVSESYGLKPQRGNLTLPRTLFDRVAPYPLGRMSKAQVAYVGFGLAATYVVWLLPAYSVGLLLPDQPILDALLGFGACVVFVCYPNCGPFERDRKVYLRPPNPFVHLYDDPNTRHWLVRDGEAVAPS